MYDLQEVFWGIQHKICTNIMTHFYFLVILEEKYDKDISKTEDFYTNPEKFCSFEF